MDTSSRVALVTGAGRGIGRAVAVALADAGYSVALTARSAPELEATAAACSTSTLVLPGDITDPGFVSDLVGRTEGELGPVDVLVANAGAGVSARMVSTTDEQWHQMLDINLTAPFRCMRAVVPGMQERGEGRVVVIASVAAKIGEPYISAYTAAKHGVLGLVRSAARELAGTGVTVNAVCPGYVDTPMTDATIAGIVAKTGRSEQEARAILAAKQPINRLITPEEVADVVMLCVTNGGITGQGLNVDGGGVMS